MRTLILSLAALVLSFATLPARADIKLATNGGDPCPIYFVSQEDAAPAQELAKYLSMITGAAFKTEAFVPNSSNRAIVVGFFLDNVPRDLGPDSFAIATKYNRLYVNGVGPRGKMFGIFAFLRDHAGCRWWSYNEEDIPKSPTLKIGEIDTVVRPAFEVHDLFNREAQSGENNFNFKSRAVSTVQFTGNHTLCPLLKPYVEKHPDFLPMNDKGERKWNDLHMNYTAPEMPAALAEALGKEVESRKGNVRDFIYFAGMGDWYGGMDLSSESKKIYEEETWTDPDGVKKPGYTGTLLRMINKTAEQLEAKYPGVRVGTFAYMSLEAPPAITKPRDNVIIWIPRLRHDTVLSIEESDKNKSFRRNVERWCEIAPGRVYIWEYGANYTSFPSPFPCLRSMAANIKLYHKLGVKGVMVQGNYVSTGGDLAVLKNYVWSRLLWEPSLDVDKLVAEFCEGYYGPAAADMIAYVNTIEDSVRKPAQIHANEFDKPRAKYLTDELVAKLNAHTQAALAKTKNDEADPVRRRVREAAASVEAALLWAPGPVEEKNGQLIRADLGGYTYPRALELVKHLRKTSNTEWSQGHSQRMGLLTLHGGPLPALAKGGLTVKVAPVQGRIWSVTYSDKEVLRQSVTQFSAGASYHEPLGEATASKVAMRAELGVGNWSPDAKQIARQTVELASDGAIVVKAFGKQLSGAADFAKMGMTIETEYPAGGDPSKIMIETRGADGAWKGLAVTAAAPEATAAGASALRATRVAEGIEVIDAYSVAKVQTIKALFDAKTGAVRTVVQLEPVGMKVNEEVPAMERGIVVSGK